jgi:hypothetical protein
MPGKIKGYLHPKREVILVTTAGAAIAPTTIMEAVVESTTRKGKKMSPALNVTLGPKLSSGFLAVLRPAFCKKYWFAERRTQNSQFRDYRFCSVLVSCILPTFENELLAQNAD